MGRFFKLVCVLSILLVLFSIGLRPAMAAVGSNLFLIADDGKFTFLGNLDLNPFDYNSIFDQFGDYGNLFSATSIWNQFGEYGNPYSAYSPFNAASSTPPWIVDANLNVGGRLTANCSISGAVNPYLLYGEYKEINPQSTLTLP